MICTKEKYRINAKFINYCYYNNFSWQLFDIVIFENVNIIILIAFNCYIKPTQNKKQVLYKTHSRVVYVAYYELCGI